MSNLLEWRSEVGSLDGWIDDRRLVTRKKLQNVDLEAYILFIFCQYLQLHELHNYFISYLFVDLQFFRDFPHLQPTGVFCWYKWTEIKEGTKRTFPTEVCKIVWQFGIHEPSRASCFFRLQATVKKLQMDLNHEARTKWDGEMLTWKVIPVFSPQELSIHTFGILF